MKMNKELDWRNHKWLQGLYFRLYISVYCNTQWRIAGDLEDMLKLCLIDRYIICESLGKKSIENF